MPKLFGFILTKSSKTISNLIIKHRTFMWWWHGAVWKNAEIYMLCQHNSVFLLLQPIWTFKLDKQVGVYDYSSCPMFPTIADPPPLTSCGGVKPRSCCPIWISKDCVTPARPPPPTNWSARHPVRIHDTTLVRCWAAVCDGGLTSRQCRVSNRHLACPATALCEKKPS